VFENRMLKIIFGPVRDEIAGGCRKLHDEELYNLYCSPNTVRPVKSRMMIWAGHREIKAYKISIVEREGRRLPGRPRRRW
jgi:hypothetical protein